VAHDFLGTFNNHQFSRLQAFLQNQQSDVPGRVLHLLAEQQRIGTLQFTYDSGGNPIGYNANPQTSYIGKLMMAYEILGGDPIFDLQIRSMSQPVFMLAGSETTPAQQLSSGDILGTHGLRDAPSAAYVQQMKGWTEDVVQYKRENIERKIRRMMDYSDQLGAEIQTLSIILNDGKTTGSLADLLTQVTNLLSDPSYRPIYNDTTGDIHGKLSHAPFSQYDPGPNRTIDPNWVRTDGGAILPGQQSPPTDKAT
jgi:hypothetical protein